MLTQRTRTYKRVELDNLNLTALIYIRTASLTQFCRLGI